LSYVKVVHENKLLGTSIAALTELLKFLYNISFHIKLDDEAGSTYSPSNSSRLMSRLAKPLIQLILAASSQEFTSPYRNAVHCCLNLNPESTKPQLFPESSPTKLVAKLIEILDNQIPDDTESVTDGTLNANLSPVVAFLTNLQEVSPDQVKSYLKSALLPSETFYPHFAQSNYVLVTVPHPSGKERTSQPASFVSPPMPSHKPSVKQS
jgi:Guanine nucleotide exchange factor synembryn